MKYILRMAAALFAATAIAIPTQAQKSRKPARAAQIAAPRQENQFVTVEEFVSARRAPRTVVSVEGYIVEGLRASDGSLRLMLVDSVDHVMNARDADKMAAAGARVVAPASAAKKSPHWAWTSRWLLRLVMYTGTVRAQKALHDVVPKVRLRGATALGRASINPVTLIESQDENGDWRKL